MALNRPRPGAGSGRVFFRIAHDQQVDLGVADEAAGGTAQQQGAEAAVTVRGDDDHVSFLVVGDLDDAVCGLIGDLEADRL